MDTHRPEPTAADCILHTTLTQSRTYTLNTTPTHTLLSCHTQTHSLDTLQSAQSGLFSLIIREEVRMQVERERWGLHVWSRPGTAGGGEREHGSERKTGTRGERLRAENKMWSLLERLRIIVMPFYRRYSRCRYYDNTWRSTVEYTTAPRLPGVSVYTCVLSCVCVGGKFR